jgi:hypothetical protein
MPFTGPGLPETYMNNSPRQCCHNADSDLGKRHNMAACPDYDRTAAGPPSSQSGTSTDCTTLL